MNRRPRYEEDDKTFPALAMTRDEAFRESFRRAGGILPRIPGCPCLASTAVFGPCFACSRLAEERLRTYA